MYHICIYAYMLYALVLILVACLSQSATIAFRQLNVAWALFLLEVSDAMSM